MLSINICVGSACHLKGSYKVIDQLQKLIDEYNLKEKVELKGQFCLGYCTEGVSVRIEEKVYSLKESNVKEFFQQEVIRRAKL
ncbi:NAD(P)H-dependent oxidoreductase subunit E [Clostridium malenominatum]|uniref:NAD(P)H-dependent oxidoreductase subunit E n=1 Tax=Clostridium malenominatum TaxID=1539 RepID=A0ABP3U8L0_9CLOT